MSLASTLAKLSFCRQIARTPGSFLQLVLQTKVASRRNATPSPARKATQRQYLLNLPNAPLATTLRTHAGDLSILYEIFWEHSYDLPVLRQGQFRTVVDVGANVGLAALFFLQRFPVSRLVCVEPEAANFRLLQANLRGTPAVTVQAALSPTDGTLRIDASTQAYNAKISTDADALEVPAISMRTLLQTQKLTWVDLLKIDIEDYEQQVFAGPTEWLAQVNTLLIEIHSRASHVAVRRAVLAQGFTWEQVAGRHPDTGLFVARNPRLSLA
jgi:FkbM family methyltransferase